MRISLNDGKTRRLRIVNLISIAGWSMETGDVRERHRINFRLADDHQ